ncbi:hypothetical protein ACQPVP_06970 [Clostridium nigeriense]|uniref:hypothetical protein n=1 Tax=Clostridium nigeriense TaxID=1805470 RepID=UPI003D355E5B
MIEDRCFCEKCRKIQPIIVMSVTEHKDFNIGKISYKKLIGKCSICGVEVYSLELSEKNKIELNKKIKELEDEVTIFKIIENNKSGTLKVKEDDDEILKEIEKILLSKNKER